MISITEWSELKMPPGMQFSKFSYTIYSKNGLISGGNKHRSKQNIKCAKIERRVRYVDGKKYITINNERILLSQIRGKYKYADGNRTRIQLSLKDRDYKWCKKHLLKTLAMV